MSADMITITIESNDNQQFTLEEEKALNSETIRHLVEDAGTDDTIPLSNVTGKVLEKVVVFLNEYTAPVVEEDTQKEKRTDDLTPWELDFFKVDQAMLFELILAANYLDIKPMLDTACKTVANMIKGKTPEEIRKTFNIKVDFTPEEEEQVRKENEWCEER